MALTTVQFLVAWIVITLAGAAIWTLCIRLMRPENFNPPPRVEMLAPICGQCGSEIDLTPGASPHVCPQEKI